MRIGIIGCGRIGGTLARHFSAADHEVAVSNSRDPESLAPVAQALPRVRPVTPPEAARFGQVVVVSIPFGRYRDLPADELTGTTVVDTTNYVPERDGPVPELDGLTSSEVIQRHLPAAHVVKAFNTMRWDHLRDFGHEAGALERYGIPVSGDDDGAKWTALDLVEQIGFQPVDVGGLADGGRWQQPGGPAYLADLTAGQLRARAGVPVR
ncbi:NADPH-dependent F420 reductase [Plantactinospora sp. GCM10030261]|uniref:NADPH-dependent F420 reductase n=1 Tax=Plantactinospora sp. GCM10030261 TaxID=3273420 RepID=UPI00361A8FDA